MSLRFPGIVAAIAVVPLALAGCAGASSPSGTDDGRISVVAVTDVWGDVAKQVGGDLVDVTAFIKGTSQDPHSFEATAQDQLAVRNADLIVENGGGYDDFMGTLIDASGTSAPVIDAVDVSGLPGAGEDGFNEHVFYDFGAVGRVAEAIAEALSAADPDDAATFDANLSSFTDRLAALTDREAEIAKTAAGAEVVITEPVPLYLLEASGFENVTPEAFSEAIEEGTDISPALLDEVIGLVRGGTVRLFAVNSQTTGPESEAVSAAAEQAGVPTVGFTETLPDGQDYLSWMAANLDAVAAALK